MKFNLTKLNDEAQYELLIDFAQESMTLEINGYYIKRSELHSSQKLRLYIDFLEEETRMYYFDEYSIDSVLNIINYKDNDECISLTCEFMSKFCLIRYIPPKGVKYVDSFLRIRLK